MRRLLGALVLLASLAQGGWTQVEDDIELRAYDVGSLRDAVGHQSEYVPAGLQLYSAMLSSYDREEPYVPLASASEDGLVWTLTHALNAMTERGVATAERLGDRVLLHATPEQHAVAERLLRELEQELLQPITFEAYLVSPHAVPEHAGAVLAPGEVDALLARAEPSVRLRTTVLQGQRARLVSQRTASQLGDLDVEVALPERIGDPHLETLVTGTELGAVARRGAGGSWSVDVWGRHGETVALRIWVLAPFAPTTLLLPRIESTHVHASALLADGEGVVLGSDEADTGLWLLRVRGDARSPQSSYVPVGAALHAPFRLLPFAYLPLAPSGGWSWMGDAWGWGNDDGLGDAGGPWPEGDGWKAALLGEERAREFDAEEADLRWHWLIPDERDARDVHARFAELEARLAGNLAIEARYGFASAELLGRWDRGELDASELAARLDRRAIGSVRCGGSFRAYGGSHRRYVKDFDVEIPLSGPDPILRVLPSGVGFFCHPTRLVDGRLLVFTQLSFQRERFLPRVRPVAMGRAAGLRTRDGAVELPSTVRAVREDQTVMEEGVWTVVSLTTVPGVDGTLVAALRITR